jgi:hypothetical protein
VLEVLQEDGHYPARGQILAEGSEAAPDLLADEGVGVLSLFEQFEEDGLGRGLDRLPAGQSKFPNADHRVFGQARAQRVD